MNRSQKMGHMRELWARYLVCSTLFARVPRRLGRTLVVCVMRRAKAGACFEARERRGQVL